LTRTVLKFGGTSVASPTALESLARIVAAVQGDRVVVVSATAGTTDALHHAAREAEAGRGAEAERVLRLAEDAPELRALACSCEGVTFAELAFCLREEFADSLADLRRRCRLAMGICQGTRCAGPAAALIATERQLTFDGALSELTSLLDERWKGNRAVLTGDGLAQAELAQGAYYTTGALGGGGGTPWR
jgi:hypothetical protein